MSDHILQGIILLVVALCSGGLAVERYKAKIKKEEEQRQNDSQFKVAKISDSAAMVEKLLPQIDRLFEIEKLLVQERLAFERKLMDLEREIIRCRIDYDEQKEELTAKVVEASGLGLKIVDLEATLTQLRQENKRLNGLVNQLGVTDK